MAINYADGTIFTSIVLYPIAAGLGAGSAGAGWFTPLFIVAGVAFGVVVIYVGRKIIYGILEFGMRRTSSISPGRLQQIVVSPLVILYVVLPFVFIGGGIFGTWLVSIWLVRHVL